MVRLERFPHNTRPAHDSDQKIVEVMRHSSGQHADAVQFFALPERPFGTPLILDVRERPEPADRPSVGGGKRRCPHQMPAPRLILSPPQPELGLERASGSRGFVPFVPHAGSVVRVNQTIERPQSCVHFAVEFPQTVVCIVEAVHWNRPSRPAAECSQPESDSVLSRQTVPP